MTNTARINRFSPQPKIARKEKVLSLASLKKKAIDVFNAWIRNRDKDQKCISCGGKVEQAGHFYSAGHYNALRFNEDNCHGQCVQCNYYKSGNLNEYRRKLILKIGEERVKKLDLLADMSKRNHTKHSRLFYLEVIEKYRIK